MIFLSFLKIDSISPSNAIIIKSLNFVSTLIKIINKEFRNKYFKTKTIKIYNWYLLHLNIYYKTMGNIYIFIIPLLV